MRQGFTLIQISILLLVASLVLVTILPSTQTNLNANSATTIKMNSVLAALREFQAAHGMLPCPADASQPIGSTSYGVAAAGNDTTNNCGGGSPAANYIDSGNNIAIGMVPLRALGLSNNYALDGYGRDITYAVDTDATTCGWPSSSLAGKIIVTDNGTATNTLAALVSHGADGHGAWIPLTGASGTAVRLNAGSTDTDQLTNAHVDSSFTPTATLTNFVKKIPTSTFDDLVIYKNPLWNITTLSTASAKILSITPPPNGLYVSSQTLTFTIAYSAPVTVNTTGGIPYLSLSAITGNVGTGNVAKATYRSGSGTTTLTFSYLIVGGSDSAPSGLTMTSFITLNGGLIQSGNFCPATAFGAPNLSLVIIHAYTYVRSITIDHTKVGTASNTDQANFPVLVSATYSYLATQANGGNIQNTVVLNGQTVPADLTFTSDSACAAKLNWEVASYTPTTGQIEAWVKVPTVSHSSDTVIYMCYDNMVANTYQSTAANAWDANFNGIWHLPNGTTLSLLDSTGNANNLSNNNSVSATAGAIDGGAGFTAASSQFLAIPDNGTFFSADLTYSFWMYVNGPQSQYAHPLIKGYGNGPPYGRYFVQLNDLGNDSTEGMTCIGMADATDNCVSFVSGTFTSATWYYITATYNSTTGVLTAYINGSYFGTGTASGSKLLNSDGGPLALGYQPTYGQYFNGRLDEVRVSNIVRSADWIMTEYNNQNIPDKALGAGGFYTIGSAVPPH